MDTKITNGISGGAEKILTATDISTGYVDFDFKGKGDNNTNLYLASAISLKSTANVLKPIEGFIVDNETTAGRVRVSFAGAGVAEVSTVEAVADVAGSLNDTYFYLYAPTGDYYVWFNVNSGGTDPSVADHTAIPVALATGATADAVASAIQVAVDAVGAFGASVDGAVVTVTNAAVGAVEDTADSAVPTGFTFETLVEGVDATEVGALAGDVLSIIVQPRYPYRETVLA